MKKGSKSKGSKLAMKKGSKSKCSKLAARKSTGDDTDSQGTNGSCKKGNKGDDEISEWDAPREDEDMYWEGFVDGYKAAWNDMAEMKEGDYDGEYDGTTDGSTFDEDATTALAMKKGSKSKGSKLASKKGSKSKGSKLATKKGSKSKGSKLALEDDSDDDEDWDCSLLPEGQQEWCFEWEALCYENPDACWDDLE